MHAADLANVNLMNTLHMTQMAALRAWWRPHYLQLAVPHLRDDLLRDITLSIDAAEVPELPGDLEGKMRQHAPCHIAPA